MHDDWMLWLMDSTGSWTGMMSWCHAASSEMHWSRLCGYDIWMTWNVNDIVT
jgi:hypothetical protein